MPLGRGKTIGGADEPKEGLSGTLVGGPPLLQRRARDEPEEGLRPLGRGRPSEEGTNPKRGLGTLVGGTPLLRRQGMGRTRRAAQASW
jgi:hypothetical protein